MHIQPLCKLFIGPFFLCCAFLLANMQGFGNNGPILGIGTLGLLLCCQWRWRGLIVSCLLVAAAFALSPGHLTLLSTTLCFSILSSLVVTVLLLEESTSQIQSEAETQAKKINRLNGLIDANQELIDSQKEQISHHDRLHDLMKSECLTLSERHETLMKELIESRKANPHNHAKVGPLSFPQIAEYTNKIGELEEQLNALQDENCRSVEQWKKRENEYAQKIAEQEDHCCSLDAENQRRLEQIAGYKKQHDEYTQQIAEQTRDLNELKAKNHAHEPQVNHFKDLQQDLLALMAKHSILQTNHEALLSEKMELKKQTEHLKAELEQCQKTTGPSCEISPENGVTLKEFNRINGLYHQLKEQFYEKSTQLDTARQHLFYSQEQLAVWKKESEEYLLQLEQKHQAYVAELCDLMDDEMQTLEKKEHEIAELTAIIDRLTQEPLVPSTSQGK